MMNPLMTCVGKLGQVVNQQHAEEETANRQSGT